MNINHEMLKKLSPAVIRRALARKNLADYATLMYPTYKTPPHIMLIANALERVERGECKRLMIFTAPRHGKSMLTSEFFPAWFLGRNPQKYLIHTSYSQDLVDDFGRKIRNQLQDPMFKGIFPDCVLASDSASISKFNTTKSGVYYGAGVGGAITGRGAHIMLIDDPLKGREEADSEVIRAKLKNWYRSVAYTRLMPEGAVVIIQTRWHQEDLAGWQLKDHADEGWEVIELPAEAKYDDVLGRKPGEPLWPESYPAESLAKIKKQLGAREWSALYQQEPLPDDGAIFNIEWFNRYEDLPGSPDFVIHSWDTAAKDSDIHDPSSCTVWNVYGGKAYLVDRVNIRVQFPDLVRAVQNLARRDKPNWVLIEDKSSGQQLLQTLRVETQLPCIGIVPKDSKVIRAQGVTGFIEAGRVYLPASAPWIPDYLAQLANFPQSRHDDDVDSTTQALQFIIERVGKRKSIDSIPDDRIPSIYSM